MNTTELAQPKIDPNMELADVFASASGSAAGYHAVSTWLTCPEQSRLKSLGVRSTLKGSDLGGEQLSALDLGTLVHHLRAVRIIHGVDAMDAALRRWSPTMHPDDVNLVSLLFAVYEMNYPLARDRQTFEVLGVEAEVVTNVAASPHHTPIYRTVRYDTVIRDKSGAVFSFEAKTMSRSGQNSLNAYTTQAMVQQTLWNRNPALVAKYGKMRGVLFDCLVKTKAPNVDRVGPRHFGRVHEEMTLSYLRLPENGGVKFEVQPDGTFPKMLHACYGRYSPCEYVNLCHEQSFGEYEFRDGRPYRHP